MPKLHHPPRKSSTHQAKPAPAKPNHPPAPRKTCHDSFKLEQSAYLHRQVACRAGMMGPFGERAATVNSAGEAPESCGLEFVEILREMRLDLAENSDTLLI